MYLDESGYCLESPLVYGYGKLGQQKSITQNQNRGRRINVMGVFETEQSFEYVLKVGTYKAHNYIQFMANQARKAAQRLSDTGRLTVVIQNNASFIVLILLKGKYLFGKNKGYSYFLHLPIIPK